MKILFTILFIAITCSTVRLVAQSDTVGFDDWYDPEMLERGENIDFGSDFIKDVSIGWFPKPFAQKTWLISINTGWNIDRASGLRSSGFVPTAEPFSHVNPYPDPFFTTSYEREFVLPNSNETDDEARRLYFSRQNVEFISTYQFAFSFPLIVDISAGAIIRNSLLYSTDRSREYLSLAGVPRKFTEVGNIALLERMTSLGIGASLPLYGAFLDMEGTRIASFYYLRGELSGTYTVSHRFSQYTQIMDAKTELRYGNGRDTVSLVNDGTLPSLEPLRLHAGVSIGWLLYLDSFAMNFELFGRQAITSVVQDGTWRQYQIGLKFGFGSRDD